jgi:hypothetical protein
MKTKNKIMFMSVALMAGIFLMIVGITYTWFNVIIKPEDEKSTNAVVKAANLGKITFYNGEEISMDGVYPGWCETKKVSIKSEDSSVINDYSIYLNIVVNELSELGSNYGYVTMKSAVVDAETQVTTGSTGVLNLKNIIETSGKTLILTGKLGTGEIHIYNIEFCFPELGIDQNSQQGKAFNAYLSVDSEAKTHGIDTDIANANSASDSELNSISVSILNCVKNDYNNNDTCNYGEVSQLVGKEIPIYLEGYGKHNLRIANSSAPDECKTEGFSQSACGLVLEFADIITKYNMNTTNTNIGGWVQSTVRTFINNDIYNSFPTELKSLIINTEVISGYGKDDSANFTSTDKLYLLDAKEIYGTSFTSTINTAKDYQRQLDYYLNENVTSANYSLAIKKYENVDDFWWLRSARSYGTDSFFRISYLGGCGGGTASNTYGISVAFRIM